MGTNQEQVTTSPSASGYNRTASGKLVHPSCSHAIPSGAMVDANGDVIAGGTIDNGHPGAVAGGQLVDHIGACAHPAIDPASSASIPSGAPGISTPNSPSYVEGSWAYVNDGHTFYTSLGDNITVPQGAIANAGQSIYLWAGFETYLGDTIIQTVLQAGPATVNGTCGTNWGLSTWFLGADGSDVHTQVTCGVNPGDSITNYLISLKPCNGAACWWLLDSYDNNTGVGSSEYFFANFAFVQAFAGVLEGYSNNNNDNGFRNCNLLPGNGIVESASFTNTSVYEVFGSSPVVQNWQTFYDDINPYCAYITYSNAGGPTLYF